MSAEKLKFARFRGCVIMAHLGRRPRDSGSVIDLSQLPSPSPSGSYHLKIHIGQLLRPGLTLVLVLAALPGAFAQGVGTGKSPEKPLPPVVRSLKGDFAASADGAISLRNATKRQQFNGSQKSTFDRDIASPKSAGFHPDGSRLYVTRSKDALRWCTTPAQCASSRS